MAHSHPSRLLSFGLVLLLASALGPRCSQMRFAGIAIDDPLAAEIFVAGSLQVSARVGREHGEATMALDLQGVDLAAALGLVPPFLDESGVVLVASDAVTVMGFTLESPAAGPRRVEATISGLSAGPWTIDVRAVKTQDGVPVTATRDVAVVDSMTLEAVDLPAAALPGGPRASDTQGILANGSLGQALAAPPIATLGGGSIRSGHVEAAEALIANGGS
jgi:hypothetical protein